MLYMLTKGSGSGSPKSSVAVWQCGSGNGNGNGSGGNVAIQSAAAPTGCCPRCRLTQGHRHSAPAKGRLRKAQRPVAQHTCPVAWVNGTNSKHKSKKDGE